MNHKGKVHEDMNKVEQDSKHFRKHVDAKIGRELRIFKVLYFGVRKINVSTLPLKGTTF